MTISGGTGNSKVYQKTNLAVVSNVPSTNKVSTEESSNETSPNEASNKASIEKSANASATEESANETSPNKASNKTSTEESSNETSTDVASSRVSHRAERKANKSTNSFWDNLKLSKLKEEFKKKTTVEYAEALVARAEADNESEQLEVAERSILEFAVNNAQHFLLEKIFDFDVKSSAEPKKKQDYSDVTDLLKMVYEALTVKQRNTRTSRLSSMRRPKSSDGQHQARADSANQTAEIPKPKKKEKFVRRTKHVQRKVAVPLDVKEVMPVRSDLRKQKQVKLSQQIKPKVPGDCNDEENLQLGENQDSGEKSRSNVTTDGAWTLVVSANDLLHNLNTEEVMTMHLLKAEKYVRGTTDLETLFDSLSRALSSNKRSKKEEELKQEVDCSLPLIVRAENLLKYCRLHFKKLGDTLWYFNSSTETESRPLYVLVSLLKKSELDLLAELKKTRDESSYEELDEMLQMIGEELKENMAEFYLDQDLESSINETKTDRKQESRKDENNSSSDAAKENQKVDLAKNLEKERKSKQDLARSLEKEKDDLTKNLEKERKSKQELTKSLEKEKEAKDDLAKNLEKEKKLKQDLAKKLGKEQKHNSELVASLEAANEENSRLKDSLKSEVRAKQELQVTLREKEREKKELIEMIEKKEKESVEQNWTKNVPKTGYKTSGEKTRIT